MKKPTISQIKPDIKNVSIYLRSIKKWGKTTLFRNLILAKYGDPDKGLLVKCGNETGDTLLDYLNSVEVSNYNDLKDLKSYLINKTLITRDNKGKIISKEKIDHDIQIVAFDTADELVLITDKETVRLANEERTEKQGKIKSIKAAFGGYTAGEKYSANDLIKPFMKELKDAGFGVWAIAHTSYKTIKERGSLDEEGYMQLTSNLSKDYESAFGDIFDIVLTGVEDNTYDEKTETVNGKAKTKKYKTSSERRLYFRSTNLIDAGGRFSSNSVPEYMVFEDRDDDDYENAVEFLNIIETGMENSKFDLNRIKNAKKFTPKLTVAPKEAVKEESIVQETPSVADVQEEDIFEEETSEETKKYPDDLLTEVKKLIRSCKDKELKLKIKGEITESGGKINDCDIETLQGFYDALS